MTSGLPPGTAVLRRAGAFGPPAVASALSIPDWLVFVGTVLLSAVLRWCRDRCGWWIERAAANHPPAGHGKPRARQGAGGDPPWACRPRHKRPAIVGVPDARPRRHPGVRRPVTPSPIAASVGKPGSSGK